LISARTQWCSPGIRIPARGALVLLAENGITRDEARHIRDEVGKRMLAYNSILWDWTHLGMCDLLEAHRGLGERRFRNFYAWAQEIALRAGLRKPWRQAAS
jgi:hypothetical protein